jgi:hypothetical protein
MPDANQESNHVTLCQGITTNFRTFDFSKKNRWQQKNWDTESCPQKNLIEFGFPNPHCKDDEKWPKYQRVNDRISIHT